MVKLKFKEEKLSIELLMTIQILSHYIPVFYNFIVGEKLDGRVETLLIV
jgi:hypothetical protein